MGSVVAGESFDDSAFEPGDDAGHMEEGGEEIKKSGPVKLNKLYIDYYGVVKKNSHNTPVVANEIFKYNESSQHVQDSRENETEVRSLK